MTAWQFVDDLRRAIQQADAEAMIRLRSVDPENLRRQQGVLDGIAIVSTAMEAIVERYTRE